MVINWLFGFYVKLNLLLNFYKIVLPTSSKCDAGINEKCFEAAHTNPVSSDEREISLDSP